MRTILGLTLLGVVCAAPINKNSPVVTPSTENPLSDEKSVDAQVQEFFEQLEMQGASQETISRYRSGMFGLSYFPELSWPAIKEFYETGLNNMIDTDFDRVLEWGRKWNFDEVETFRLLADILRTDNLPNSTDIPSAADTIDKEKQMANENNN